MSGKYENQEKNKTRLILMLITGIVICLGVTIWALFFRQSGEVLIQAGRTKEADTAFEVALIGLLQIAQSYPDHVAVSYPNRG